MPRTRYSQAFVQSCSSAGRPPEGEVPPRPVCSQECLGSLLLRSAGDGGCRAAQGRALHRCPVVPGLWSCNCLPCLATLCRAVLLTLLATALPVGTACTCSCPAPGLSCALTPIHRSRACSLSLQQSAFVIEMTPQDTVTDGLLPWSVSSPGARPALPQARRPRGRGRRKSCRGSLHRDGQVQGRC